MVYTKLRSRYLNKGSVTKIKNRVQEYIECEKDKDRKQDLISLKEVLEEKKEGFVCNLISETALPLYLPSTIEIFCYLVCQVLKIDYDEQTFNYDLIF